MIAIYLSHPFTGNEEENRRQARAYAAEIAHKRPDILIVNPLDAMQHATAVFRRLGNDRGVNVAM